MNSSSIRRLLGLSVGLALLAIGVAESLIDHADIENPKVQAFCRAGFCPAEFSPERVFEISQKATLGDARGQLEDFRRAVRLSPSSAYRWADLGDAEFNVRNFTHAEYAISQALHAGPRSPVILMRAANLYFQTANIPLVVQQLVKVLNDPDLTDDYETAFFVFSRLDLPTIQILQAVPQRKLVLSGLLNFWTKIHRPDEAVATWQWASQRQLADAASTNAFFTFLMASGHQNQAQQLWQEASASEQPGYRKSNWIFNPGFEDPPDQSPFDWNIQPRLDAVEAVRVQDVKFEGAWSLRVRFNGETNTAYHQTFQDMVLPPGLYQFSVAIKTEQVTTDEGIRIHIFDSPTQAKLNFWSDTITGTQDWKRISFAIAVPQGVSVVRAEIARNSSKRFDNKIGGTTWIDQIQLSRQ